MPLNGYYRQVQTVKPDPASRGLFMTCSAHDPWRRGERVIHKASGVHFRGIDWLPL